jgi:hypothetical protein
LGRLLRAGEECFEITKFLNLAVKRDFVMVDTLKTCSFTDGDLSLEFESQSGLMKSVVIDPGGILQLMLEVQKATQEANEKEGNSGDTVAAKPWPTSFELYQYRFMLAEDRSQLVLQFLTRDNTNFGFPLSCEIAKEMGEGLIESSEQLVEPVKIRKLTLVQ